MSRWTRGVVAHAVTGVVAAASVAVAGCGGADASDRLEVERVVVGDTTVVRTLAGSEWGAMELEPEVRIGTFEGEDEYMLGEVAGMAVAPDGSIYLYDRQVPALRKYAPDGTHIATFARQGGGPGEYQNSDGGLAVLPDGRVLLRDPGNGRINEYSAEGDVLGHWELRGGFFTSRPLFVDTAGRAYTQIWGRNAAGESYAGLQVFDPAGERIDSIMIPEWDLEPARVSVSREGMSMTWGVPFSPTETWSFSPLGYYVGGASTRYAVELFRPDGLLRIERVVDPVPVQSDEKANQEERVTANFRRSVPDWRWNGPPIPDRKPPFRAILAGRDGRVWVQLHQPAERIEGAGSEPQEPGAVPEERWREPVVFDVFEPDGTYLGQVRAPTGFRTYPQPVLGTDHVWAVVVDDMDVQYLTRFRIRRAAGDRVARAAE